MITVSDVIASLGRTRIAAAVGVTNNQVGNAAAVGRFPARWYWPLKKLCAEHDVELPIKLFNWAAPKKLGDSDDDHTVPGRQKARSH